MAEQICPHCRKSITSQDLIEFRSILRKKEIENEFRNLNSVKRIDDFIRRISFFSLLSPIMAILIMSFVKFDLNRTLVELYGEYAILSATVPGVLALVALIRFSLKRSELYNQFISERLS